MPKQNVYLQSFSVGVVDAPNLARVDLERMRLAAEDQTNFICSTTGAMSLRPGLGHIQRTFGDRSAYLKSFVYSAEDAQLLEFTDLKMRIYVDDVVLSRPAVSTTVSKGDFSGTGAWVLAPTDGATATISGSRLRLSAAAIGSKSVATQEVSVASGDRGVEHALSIIIARGPITFRCGSTNGGEQYIAETELKEGLHSLSFTPTTSSFFILFQTTSVPYKSVQKCTIESAGDVVLTSPWWPAVIPKMRFAQSADVMFVTCDGVDPYRIERRDTRSWSIVKYLVDDGPFMLDRSAPVRLKVNATVGNTTLTSDSNFFKQSHVGAIFRLFNDGQYISQSVAGAQCFTDPIRVSGVSADGFSADDRDWSYSVSGTWSGTLVCQRSTDAETFGYKKYHKQFDAGDASAITGNVSNIIQYEADDNLIVWYRIGFASDYTSGSADITINYDGGGGYGICRVVDFIDSRNVNVEVLRTFKDTVFTSDWLEGMWSSRQGFPSSVALSEGRLFLAGNDKFWGSVSDAYESFDEEIEGDSGPINRSIAIGGVNQVQSLLPLQRLEILTNGLEVSVKSSSFDEPLSPTNLSLKSSSSVGSAPMSAVKIDGSGIFADRPALALFELIYSAEANDYVAAELTRLCKSWFSSGIVQIAVSRRPDTRVWAVLENGTCMMMLYEPAQQIVAFVPIVTDGKFESVEVLPGASQDDVYFIVRRTITSATHRSVEKMASEKLAAPSVQARVMDAYVTGKNSPASATIAGATHLVGKMVKVWADGQPLTEVVDGRTVAKLFLVASDGSITLDRVVADYIYGLPYTGTYKSARLAYGAAGGTAMLQKQRINQIGLLLKDYVRSGIRYGQDFDHLWPLPVLSDGVLPPDVSSGIVSDETPIAFGGSWTTDARVCITAEWPVTVLGMVFEVTTNG